MSVNISCTLTMLACGGIVFKNSISRNDERADTLSDEQLMIFIATFGVRMGQLRLHYVKRALTSELSRPGILATRCWVGLASHTVPNAPFPRTRTKW